MSIKNDVVDGSKKKRGRSYKQEQEKGLPGKQPLPSCYWLFGGKGDGASSMRQRQLRGLVPDRFEKSRAMSFDICEQDIPGRIAGTAQRPAN